jgi:hypothetical protein
MSELHVPVASRRIEVLRYTVTVNPADTAASLRQQLNVR